MKEKGLTTAGGEVGKDKSKGNETKMMTTSTLAKAPETKEPPATAHMLDRPPAIVHRTKATKCELQVIVRR